MAVPVEMVDQKVAWALAKAADLRETVATGVGEGISRLEEARVTLQEAAALLQESAAALLQESADAVEILYDNLLTLAPHYSATPRQAGMLVDAVFNGAGPLTGAIAAAADTVARRFDSPPPSGGPLQDAVRDLGFLFDSCHAHAGFYFNSCDGRVGIISHGGTWEFWRISHEQAGIQGSQAVQRVNQAVLASIAAHSAHHLCRAESARGRPGEHMLEAQRTLQRTIAEIDTALLILRDLTNKLAALEVLVHNATSTTRTY